MNDEEARPDWLAQLPQERRDPVVAFVREVVATCPWCEATIRRTTSRAVDSEERIGCFACVHTAVGQCKLCGQAATRAQKRRESAGSIVHEECVQRRDSARTGR